MYKPKYRLSIKLFKIINDVERLYGQLEAMKVPNKLLLNITRENQIQSTYSSNKIEGNMLSVAEVTNLLLSERIPVNHDEKEVSNYFGILKDLGEKTNLNFDINLILKVHSDLMDGINDDIKGKFRKVKVVVGRKNTNGEIIVKHRPPYHDKIKITEEIKNLCQWVENADIPVVIKAGVFHHQFVYIHPFEDGNGRVCRLLTALIFLKSNYLINKYFVIDDYYDIDKEAYSDKLHSADKGDKTVWLEYFADGVKYSMESARQKLINGLSEIDFSVRPTKKELEVLEIIQKYREVTSKDLADKLVITRQRAFNLLKALVEKGYLEQIGKSKSSYYKIK